ncbi:zinc transporter 6-like [Ylistrum balloti]|uniref:zinc transporter 6-like n=1 Tax=Ylistrum balloti TaxID=509963 RepID=UPI002905D1DF|nr:zinc transporter 6-like [Ylistrum balloti]
MSVEAHGTIPDLISSSVSFDLDTGDVGGTKFYTSGMIYPLVPHKSFLRNAVAQISNVMRIKASRKILLVLGLNVLGSLLLLIWCHGSDSMALTAYTYLTLYDIFTVLICLLSIWVQMQKPNPAYSFGYERFEVLAVFASTMLAQLGALFVIKESIERLIQQPDIHTGRLLVGTVFAFSLHMFVAYSVNNRAMNHVIDASSSSWLQEHMTDMSESLCHVVPGLSKLLLPRINPLALIGFTGGLAICLTYILIDTKLYYSADTWAAISIAVMICGTMFPMSAYTGKILLQTSPAHILGQLDKLLREASTLDGVLEFRHEHFWTLSFGCLAGSVQVRVRRDADEQMVLAHVYNRLSNLVNHLTVQIFKDDWTRSSYSLLGNQGFPSNFSTIGQSGGPSPTDDAFHVSGKLSSSPLAASPFDITNHDYGHSHDNSGHSYSNFHNSSFSTTPIRGSNIASSSGQFSINTAIYGSHHTHH